MYDFELKALEELRQTSFLIKKTKEQLKKYKKGFLVLKPRKKLDTYYEVTKEGDIISGGLRATDSRVMEIKMHRHLSAQLKVLQHNEKVLNYVLKHFKNYGPEALNKMVPKAYRLLTREKANTERSLKSGELSRIMPSQKSHITADGAIVRSLAEMVIYNLLLFYGVDFKYEKRLDLYDDRDVCHVYPDFTIKKKGGETIYWEHIGMFDSEDYRKRFNEKLELYYKNDIIAGGNLILTFSKKDHSIDSENISKYIRLLLK